MQVDLAIDFALIEAEAEAEGGIRGDEAEGKGKGRHNDAAGKWNGYKALEENVWKTWFSPVEEGVISRVLAMAGKGNVAEDVELGFHFCYGDSGHKHFVEPKDTGRIARVMNAVLEGCWE